MKYSRRLVIPFVTVTILLATAYGILNRVFAREPQQPIVPISTDRFAKPSSHAELEAASLPFGGKLAAQITVAEMQAFDAANPDMEQRVAPKGSGPDLAAKASADNDGSAAAYQPEPPPEGDPLQAPPLVTNFAGTMDDGNNIPPDTHGAVGPNHVAVILNSGFAVYTRAGAVVVPQIALRSVFFALGIGAGQPANRPFDPKLLYDQYAGRWVMVCDSNGNGRPNSYVLIGMSHTNDPTGPWNQFAIRADNVGPHPANSHWADYPGFGLDPNNVIITNNIFSGPPANNYIHTDVWVINKSKLTPADPSPLVGGTDYALFHDPDAGAADPNGQSPGFTYQPCHTFGQTAGNARNYLVVGGYSNAARRFFRVKRIIGTGAAAFLDSRGGNDYVEVQGYSFAVANGTQPGGCLALDTQNGTRLLNAVLRNDSIWTTHHIGNLNAPNMAEVGWYKLGTTMVGPKAAPPMAALQGKIMSTNQEYYYPSIAVDKFNCAMIGFSGSDAATFASAFYTVRPGNESVAKYKGGLARYHKIFTGTDNRWGDYSMTCVDPVDDSTLWTLQEYAETETPPGACAANTGKWGTWWAATRCGLAPCNTCLGDINGDGKVDAKDMRPFIDCRLGLSPPNACGCADFDRDGDVDGDDQLLFVFLLVLPNPGC